MTKEMLEDEIFDLGVVSEETKGEGGCFPESSQPQPPETGC